MKMLEFFRIIKLKINFFWKMENNSCLFNFLKLVN